ncbi:hypothetical protein TrVE_jg2615 [Triparma verrucosa]|uniref:SUMO-activating enzyme subunit n=1 Tax=Triparma verrucosa TaxID=1606542 RepID=A0A9W7BTX0_9STRA|nr:hypothetical protein TrVE_jg2615 [Triparma verrucosa]
MDVLSPLISSSSILVIGSGGIGCELLKNLAGSGFTAVEVIDLDTIDVSNLNRQFLFRGEHVGLPKCEVACAASRKISSTLGHTSSSVPGVGFYKPHHGNVKDNSRFSTSFFKRFTVVLNALDNVSARRHVNRLCLSADIPLIEAGTTGYLGQTTVIAGKQTECYECQPKPTQKVYPICTIRSTPSMPVHCIVWGKELYKLMFGDATASMLFEDTVESDEPSTFMEPVVDSRLKPTDSPSFDSIKSYAVSALTALYTTEINKQLSMDRYKGAAKVPVAKDIEALMVKAEEWWKSNEPPSTKDNGEKIIWTDEQCCHELFSIIKEVYTTSTSPPALFTAATEFDKDNHLSMRFVTAASNLRASIFSIETSSFYTAKGIAGNIIPAIATTNAIVAGLQVLELFKILKHGVSKIKGVCKFTYCLRDKTRKGLFLQPTSLVSPNEKCYVCRNARVVLSLNTETTNLHTMIDDILKKKMSFNSPILQIGCSQIYEDGEEEYEVNLPKLLKDLPAGGIKDGTILTVEDFEQDMEITLEIVHMEFDEEDENQFIVGGDKPKPKPSKPSEKEEDDVPGDDNLGDSAAGAADANDNNDDDDIVEITEEDNANSLRTRKRGRSEEDDGAVAPKKARGGGEDEEAAIAID